MVDVGRTRVRVRGSGVPSQRQQDLPLVVERGGKEGLVGGRIGAGQPIPDLYRLADRGQRGLRLSGSQQVDRMVVQPGGQVGLEDDRPGLGQASADGDRLCRHG